MIIRDALAKATDRLRAAGVGSPEHDARALLAHTLQTSHTELHRHGILDEAELAEFDELVARRELREPLQHIVGIAGFRYTEVAVGPGVFVPRPETEALAGWAVTELHALHGSSDRPPIAVDLCTGSGVLALSLATEAPGSTVHAVELSEDAFAWASRNLADSGVHLHLGDINTALPELDGRVDVVVANPPYVPLDAYERVDVEVRDFDPPLALWSGSDGLDMIRAVEATAARLLRAGGVVGCEHSDLQGEAATAVFAGTGRWSEIRDRTDLAGRPRFVTARRSSSPGPAGTMTG